MGIMLGFLGIFIQLAGYCGALLYLEKNMQLPIQRKGRAVTDKGIWAAGILELVITAVFSIRRMEEMPLVSAVLTMVILWGMAVLSVTDAKMQVIPNKILLLLLGIWVMLAGCYLVFHLQEGMAIIALSAAGGLAGGLIFLLCYILSRRQLGAGDVKLAAVLGLYLTGQRIMGAIVYGVLLCCVYSIAMLFLKKLGLKDGVPLAPFLYMGMCITLLVL